MDSLHRVYEWLRKHFRPYWRPAECLTDEGINREIGELLNDFPAVTASLEAEAMEVILSSDRRLWPANRDAAIRRRAQFPDMETILQE